ncbi:hypothetical protein FRC12_007547, partial [Ceratobasidium sp. 428]
LKKEWLATQKIKATYRAEKRRLGLREPTASTDGRARCDPTVEIDGVAAEAQSPDEAISERCSSDRSPIGSDYNSHPIIKNTKTVKDQEESDATRLKGKEKNKGKGKERGKEGDSLTRPTTATASLREMAREAYSPASLHTHKSNPLHRKQSGKDYARRRVEAAAAREGRPTPNGREKGRGQPNMAKRMSVLLEKIKRVV